MADAAHGSMRHFLKDGLLRSVSSLMVKVGAAGLTYLMFVALSRAMGAQEPTSRPSRRISLSRQ